MHVAVLGNGTARCGETDRIGAAGDHPLALGDAAQNLDPALGPKPRLHGAPHEPLPFELHESNRRLEAVDKKLDEIIYLLRTRMKLDVDESPDARRPDLDALEKDESILRPDSAD